MANQFPTSPTEAALVDECAQARRKITLLMFLVVGLLALAALQLVLKSAADARAYQANLRAEEAEEQLAKLQNAEVVVESTNP